MSKQNLGIKKISRFKFLIKVILGIRIRQISLFCGPELSRYAGIGTWKQFAEKAIDVTDEYVTSKKLKTKFDGSQLRLSLNDDFSTALKVLNDCEAIVNKKRLLQLLSAHCSFELREGDEPLHHRHTRIHEQLALMPVLSVWTTNIDQLLEEAFTEKKVSHIVVDRLAAAAKQNHVFSHEQVGKSMPIYKYHGTCVRVQSSKDLPEVSHEVILTGKDYLKTETKPPFLSNHFDVALKYSRMLFIGYDFPVQDKHILESLVKQSKPEIRHLALMTNQQFQECKDRLHGLNMDVSLIPDMDEVGEMLYMSNRYGAMFW